jgi:hypothetical protein
MDSILEGAAWRKSSRSGNSGGSCVELACALEVRAIRDSKNPAGGVLLLEEQTASTFLSAVKAGAFG